MYYWMAIAHEQLEVATCVEAMWKELSDGEVFGSGFFLEGNCLRGNCPGGTVLVGELSGGEPGGIYLEPTN